MRYCLICIVMGLVIVGCRDENSPLVCETAKRVRNHLYDVATNACIRSVSRSKEVRNELNQIREIELRRSLVSEWTKTLLNIAVEDPPTIRKCETVKEAVTVLDWDVVGAMVDIGCSKRDIWQVRLDALELLDKHILKLKEVCLETSERTRANLNLWTAYQMLTECREYTIEGHERFDLEEGEYEADEFKEIKDKFEAKISRSVRRREEIVRLGVYAKEACEKIQQRHRQVLQQQN